LTASGGIAYRWSPESGLDCPDCPTTPARPTVTTDYIVTVTGPDGCSALDTIRVAVEPTDAVTTARIDRSHRVFPSSSIRIPILLAPMPIPLTSDSVDISLRYDSRILRLIDVDLSATPFSAWIRASEQNDPGAGSWSISLRAPAPQSLDGPDTLAWL